MGINMPPALKALIVQGAAAAMVLALFPGAAFFWGSRISPLAVVFAIGLSAAAAGALWRLPPWWLPIQLFFAPALLGMLSMQLPPAWFLGALALLLVIYGGVFYGRVPLYLSSRQVKRAVAELLPDGPFRFIDLGCGLGGMAAYLAGARPQGTYLGVEAALLPYALSWLRSGFSRRRWAVAWGSFWRRDVGPFDVIYAYLSPAPMPRLGRKLRAEMQPAALFISNAFPLPGIEPAATVELQDIHHSILYVYRYADLVGRQSSVPATGEARYVENR